MSYSLLEFDSVYAVVVATSVADAALESSSYEDEDSLCLGKPFESFNFT